MSNPTGVDANAAVICTGTISLTSMANVRIFTRLIIRNTVATVESVNCYVVVDGNVYRALPLVYPASAQYAQEFTTRVVGLAAGNHTYQLYAGASAAGVEWVTVDADWDIFYA